MQISDLPRRIRTIWASAASGSYVRQVPDSGASGGNAGYDTGFPPLTFTSEASGGVPPDGRDMNGVLMDLSAWSRWVAAGGSVLFDGAFASTVGGYPKYCILASTTPGTLWQSTVDGNATDPDGGSAANWIRVSSTFGSASNSITYPDGKVDQWGRVDVSGAEIVVPVSLSVPYSNGLYNISISPHISAPSTSKDDWVQVILSSITTSGFSVQYQRENSGPNLDGFYWRTIGK